MDQLALIAQMLAPRRQNEPIGRPAPLGQPRDFPGRWGAPPVADPMPRWLAETRGRVPQAGLPERRPPLMPPENFPIGPGAILPPEPWELPPAPRHSVSGLTGQEPSLAASVADVMAPPRRPLPDALMARAPAGGPQSPAMNEPESAPNAPRLDLDAEWNAALARARGARTNKVLRPRR